MFSNSKNIQINGGHYVHNSPSQKIGGDNGLDILRQNIAFGATHDSGERFDPPKCDPDTRVAIIQEIMAWVNDSDSQKSSSMLWLRGSTGVGKSSIAQTIAEFCNKNECLAGSFFFSRTAPNRSDGRLLISTLSYQLTSTFPAARSIIGKAVNRDPLILQLSLEGQMQNLFIEPVNRVARSPIRRYLTHHTRSHPRLVVIDGLDECSDPAVQCEILKVLSSSLQSLHFPIRFLIASRPELHITRSFDELRPNTPLHEIDLSEDVLQANSDIRTFLVKQFKKIKETHPLQLYLPLTWPMDENVDELVRRSSSQFSYASVAMQYIGCAEHQPVERLDIVLDLHSRPAKDSELSFAQLDELYMHLLSSVDRIDIVLKILGILIIPQKKMYKIDKYSTPKMLEKVLNLQPGDVELHLTNLQPVIAIISPSEPIRMLHTSLADFLVDPSRAGPKFYVNIGFSHAILAGECIRSATKKHQSTKFDWDLIIAHLKKAVLTESLFQDLLDFPFLAIFDRVKSLAVTKERNPKHTRKSALASYIWGWITAFLSCFHYQSTLFDCEASKKIHAQLLLRFDTYLKNQLARCTVDDVFLDLLALVTCRVQPYLRYQGRKLSYLETPDAQEPPSWHPNKTLWDVDKVVLNVVLILSGFTRYAKRSVKTNPHRRQWVHIAQPIRKNILEPLRQFLLDPERSGDYFVDDAKYARTALRCLRQLCQPKPIPSTEGQIPALLNTTALMLSKAATTKELVAFLIEKTVSKQTLLKSNTKPNSMAVNRLETEIQAYLKRTNDNAEQLHK